MQPENIKRMIELGLPGARVSVTGDGRHFEAVVVAPGARQWYVELVRKMVQRYELDVPVTSSSLDDTPLY